MQTKIDALQKTKTEARHQELKAIEWKELWGKPAAFAAVILVLFVALFRGGAPKPREA